MNPHGGGPASPPPSSPPSPGAAPAPSSAATPKACPSCGARYAADALFCSLDGSPLTTSPGAIAAAAANDYYVGREILGHIEIRQLVGLGAMGRVYRAFQRGIDRDVAVKILHRELSSNPAVVARFDREAKVAARLSHPNVVHVLLVGQLPDGAMYIVMEYLDGLSLQSALAAAGGALPLARALHVALQLCDAAGEAHAQGVVHRDLKPENIMLIHRADDPDFVKVLDFGIARLSWGDPAGVATAAGLIFGTARYISPEGAGGDKVGPQGDVYSMATMLYQMLAGRTPFDADQAVALLVQQMHDKPPALRSIPRAAYVPEPIAAMVMANLSKRPEDRAEDARAFGRGLLEAAMASGLSAQDILARPSLLPGGRSRSSSIQMPSMARTQQLGSEPGVVVRTEIAEPTMAPPGVATAKWVPPAAVRATLVATVPPEPSRPPSSVDPTLADEPAPGPTSPGAPPPSRRRWAAVLVGVTLAVGAVVALGRAHPAPASAPAPAPAPASASASAPASAPASASAPLSDVPPLLGLSPASSRSASQGPLKISLETSASKPGLGQPVDLTGRVSAPAGTHPRVEAARFHIDGPGIAPGTELSAIDDGSAFRTTFTFLQPGRFDVTFMARADGAPLHASRTVVVDDPTAPPPPAPPQASSSAAPTPPAKWM